MRVHWGWVLIGAVAGAVAWPMISPKIGAGKARRSS
jgi:hypothetical protein